ERLKAIADAKNQLIRVAEAPQTVSQEMGELRRQDFPRGHIVAVGEAPGHNQDLVALQQTGLFAQPIDVNALGNRPGLLEAKLGLQVAVGARSTKDQRAWNGHRLQIHGPWLLVLSPWPSIFFGQEPRTKN